MVIHLSIMYWALSIEYIVGELCIQNLFFEEETIVDFTLNMLGFPLDMLQF